MASCACACACACVHVHVCMSMCMCTCVASCLAGSAAIVGSETRGARELPSWRALSFLCGACFLCLCEARARGAHLMLGSLSSLYGASLICRATAPRVAQRTGDCCLVRLAHPAYFRAALPRHAPFTAPPPPHPSLAAQCFFFCRIATQHAPVTRRHTSTHVETHGTNADVRHTLAACAPSQHVHCCAVFRER